MRRVERATDLPTALSLASAEAESAFGDGSVYLEREIRPARHIEVQLLGDGEGTVVALGERDCSIQRRHQKLVEEAPAAGLTSDERAALHEHAVRLARAVRLTNAATAEFLFDEERRFWFLEVNTRLQVEHGVTELVSGVDIVREQFQLAAGRPLSHAVRRAAAAAAQPARHAIEVRLTAEDPSREFAPTPGTVQRWVMPSGPGVRVDSGVEAGDAVRPEYDNLFAKLLVVDDDRDSAIRRLSRALDEVSIGGLQTTVPLYRAIVRDESFRAADISTDWLAAHWDGPTARATARKDAVVLAGLTFLDGRPGPPQPPVAPRVEPVPSARAGGWRSVGRREAIDRRAR